MNAAFDRVVAELNLDTSDLFTKVLATAFALQDERNELRARLAVPAEIGDGKLLQKLRGGDWTLNTLLVAVKEAATAIEFLYGMNARADEQIAELRAALTSGPDHTDLVSRESYDTTCRALETVKGERDALIGWKEIAQALQEAERVRVSNEQIRANIAAIKESP